MGSVTRLPACCHGLSDRWPTGFELPGACWASIRFDKERLERDDFQRCGLPHPESIARAAPKRQIEFLTGRLCAREALRQLTGQASVPGVAESRAPVWPDRVIGSITHSGDFAAVVVAPTSRHAGLGLDAERMIDVTRAQRLAGQVLTPDERARMAALPLEEHGHFVTLVFSLKESLFKALFPLVGVRFYFQDAQLVEWDAATRQATLSLRKSLSDAWPAGRRLRGGYVLHESYLISRIAIPA
ncbi:MAG: 4'-phosphopantetheinyl transferase superfamily protein [Halomonas sp.]|nr:4'-phosphopantetheinyl transferase superfamily protein [Halomonas sp.]